MTWYSASIILAIRPIQGDEAPITVFENVILIEASDEDEAAEKAKEFGAREAPRDESLTIDGKRADTTFVGIRKIVTVSNPLPLDQDSARPIEGTEVTYSRFEVKTNADLKKLVAGGAITLKYLE